MPPPGATSRAKRGASPSVWTVAGGKGGVGKSFVSVHLAAACAEAGRRVVILDADLGGANLDTLLGCPHPPRTLADFFERRIPRLEDACLPTPVPGLSLLAGDSDTLGAANPHHARKRKLIRHLRMLPADLVVVDLGAGASFNVLDLYLAGDERVCVTQPEPTALQNAFAFLKAAALRAVEHATGSKQRDRVEGSIRPRVARIGDGKQGMGPTRLIVNRASPSEGRNVANALADLAHRFLGIHLVLSGTVADDVNVRGAVRQGRPLFQTNPSSPAAHQLRRIARSLLEGPAGGRAPVAMGLNESLVVDGVSVHLQTEDLGPVHGAVRSQVFLSDGSVLWSRRTPYADRFFERLDVPPAERARYHHAAVRRAILSGRVPLPLRRSA